MSAGWDDGSIGDAAVHEREQREAEIRDIVHEARLLILIASPLAEGKPDAVVRGIAALPLEMSDDERAEVMLAFLTIARAEINEMIDKLTGG